MKKICHIGRTLALLFFLRKDHESLSAPNDPTTEKIKCTDDNLSEYTKINKMYNPDENLIIRVKI